MLNKFIQGLFFGAGFAVAFITVWYLAAYLVTPMLNDVYIEHANNKPVPGMTYRASPQASINSSFKNISKIPFHEMDLDQQIKESSVIALAKYKTSEDGKVKAIISDILKKREGTTFYYKVGDEYPSSSYYPEENIVHGDGVVIFFTGSPARMKMSMTYQGDRILGLGDLPIELLRKKCAQPDT